MIFANSKIIELIYTTYPAGDGTKEDPMRIVQCFHRKDGRPVMIYDPAGLIDTKKRETKSAEVIYKENLDF